jgi:hypothetical protein
MLLATFCLRLACGLAGALWLVSTSQVNPRFYRTQFLVILGLTALSAVLLAAGADALLWGLLAVALAVAFVGALVWSMARAPFGRLPIGLTAPALAGVLAVSAAERLAPTAPPGRPPTEPAAADWRQPAVRLADDLSAAALLGTATTAMLLGHSYLIAPNMTMTPLLRLLAGLFAALGLRMLLAGIALARWTQFHSLTNLNDEVVLWLPVRWGLGFVGPLALAWMARQTARIRSTQSATGILYVAVIFCFLGELTSQLLRQQSGHGM